MGRIETPLDELRFYLDGTGNPVSYWGIFCWWLQGGIGPMRLVRLLRQHRRVA
jgi:hypothetical protein